MLMLRFLHPYFSSLAKMRFVKLLPGEEDLGFPSLRGVLFDLNHPGKNIGSLFFSGA